MHIKKLKKWPKIIQTSCRRPVMKYKKKKKRDLSGKYVILLNSQNRKVGALLKFVNRDTCKVVTGIIIDKWDLKQTSRKFIISPKKDKRLLDTIQVIVNLKFQKQYEQIVEKAAKIEEKRAKKKSKQSKRRTKDPTLRHRDTPEYKAIVASVPKVKPIKIFNCLLCNHKFTKRSIYEEHCKTHKQRDRRDSSGSENELLIDDDVMYVIESEAQEFSHEPRAALKSEPDEPTPEKFLCFCQELFDTEQSMLTHIAEHHGEEVPKSFPCSKCPVTFAKESSLIAHSRSSHPVTTISEHEAGDPEVRQKARRKSMYVSDPSKLKPSTPTQVLPFYQVPSTSSNAKITFERYNSMHKKNFVCRICSISFQVRQLLDRHVQVQHISKLFYCYKCEVPFTLLSLFTHLKTSHLDCSREQQYIDTVADVESVAMFRCGFCQFTSRQRPRVETHHRFEHYDEFEKCEDKDQQASSSDSLEELVLPDTAKKIAETEWELKKVFEYEKRTRRPWNDPSFKFRCARCQRRFLKASSLKTHSCNRSSVKALPTQQPAVRNVTPIATKATGNELLVVNGFHRCPRCPQVFTDQINFQKHVSETHDMQQTPKTGFYGTIIN